MSKFHVNPSTGTAAKCSATKACPFGDLEADHYETKEGAQFAYEQAMSASTLAPPARAKSIHDQGVERAQAFADELELSWKDAKHLALKSYVEEFPDAEEASSEEVITHLSNMAIYREKDLQAMFSAASKKNVTPEAGKSRAVQDRDLSAAVLAIELMKPEELRKDKNDALVNVTYQNAIALGQSRSAGTIRKRLAKAIATGLSPQRIDDKYHEVLKDFKANEWGMAVKSWRPTKIVGLQDIVASQTLDDYVASKKSSSRAGTSASSYGGSTKGYGFGKGKY